VIREIPLQPITPEAFAPFGDVICVEGRQGTSANQGTALRCDFAARLSSTRPDARPNLVAVRSVARPLPLELTLLEHHPCSTQVFLPMTCSRILVCVAPAVADGSPDVAGLVAFTCKPGQGICYGVGVWHHPIVALDAPADLAMLVWEDGTSLDCVEWPLAERVRVVE
jgi:ureidoglycolate lyase